VAAGVGVHRLEHGARSLLTLGADAQGAPRPPQLAGQLVAQDLELAETQQPRAVAARHGDVDRRGGKTGDQRVGELALEPGDLGPQRPAGRVLVHRRRERRGGLQQVAVGDHDHAGDSTPRPPF
jgi:hypothetical protein